MMDGMELTSRALSLCRSALPALVATLLAAPAVADEMSASPVRVSGIVVHDAQETLRDHCREQDGRLWLELPNGTRWELVTSTTDPVITNPGDGSFHPYDAAEITHALSQVRFPLDHVSAEIFVLPFPRRASLGSAAGRGLILLSPGVRPLSREHQHTELIHELGHVVQYAVLPDTDTRGWNEYRRIRGLSSDTHTSSSAHADRPHEIWAEDFRVLFGSAEATTHGTIENPTLAYPTQVAGLLEFMRTLSGAGTPHARLTVAPVSRGAVTFSRFGTGAAILDVFDAAGRRVASVDPVAGMTSVSWTWGGTDATARALQGEVVFARVRDGLGGAVRVVLAR
jgi:hypothetical protein